MTFISVTGMALTSLALKDQGGTALGGSPSLVELWAISLHWLREYLYLSL